MSRFAFCMVAAFLAASSANAKSIKWTGYAKNGQWETPTNWYPADLPGPSDDVTINSGGNVTITTPVTVSSISIGDSVGEYPYLIVDSSLIVESSLDVKGNGGIVMNSGAAAISGQVTVGGNFVFQSGSISGTWLIASPGKASFGGAAEKAFVAARVTLGVNVDMSGLIILNQSSVITLTDQGHFTITATGQLSIQAGDTTAVKLDTTAGTFNYNGLGSTFQMMAPWSVGTFNLGGGDLTLFDAVSFTTRFSIPAGSVVKTLGIAVVSMSAGVTGAGSISAEGKSLTVSAINLTSGSVVKALAGTFEVNHASSVDTLQVAGSTFVANAGVSVAVATFTAGQLQGSGSVSVASGTLQSAGFNINTTLIVQAAFTVTGSVISFGHKGSITVASTATLTTVDAVSISGPSGTNGVINNGMINAKGAFSLTNVDLTGVGFVTVADTFTVGTITIAQDGIALTGNGKFIGANTDISYIGTISGTPGVTGAIGSYSFTCKKGCDVVSTTGIPTTKFIFAVSSN